MRLLEALTIGEKLVKWMDPFCERVCIAGSVRRLKPEVKDLEVVAQPKMERMKQINLWGEPGAVVEVSELETALNYEMPAGWDWDQVLKRNGKLYKRLRHKSGLACDLFMATKRNWGGALTIRTGPADFGQALVTLALARSMQVSGGYYVHDHPAALDEKGKVVPCLAGDQCKAIIETPGEQDFFRVLDVPWMEPTERNAAAVWKLIRKAIN